MNLSQLVSKYSAQGFDYHSTSEAEDNLNDAYLLDICDSDDWPFLESSQEGIAPLTVSDLGAIQEVIDVTQERKLAPLQRGRIVDSGDVNLSTAGDPCHYFITGGDTVNVHQTSTTDTILVRYFKVPPRLTSGDSPLIPERYHGLIVTGAIARAYENSDDWELAQNAEEKFNRRLQRMKEALLYPQHDAADDFIVVTDPAGF